MNRWRIPAPLESLVRQRDQRCIYCGVVFGRPDATRGERPSWEHIVNDASLISADNIALCCIACNASKGAKPLREWLLSAYCQRKSISRDSIAAVATAALNEHPPSDTPGGVS